MQDEDITRRDEVDGTVLAMVAMTWDELNDAEKSALHIVANWPGRSIIGTVIEKADSLATEEGKTLHPEACRAIEIPAADWHRKAGRI